MKSHIYRLIALLMIASTLLAACGSGNGSEADKAAGGGSSASIEAAAAAPASASTGPLTASSTSPISVELSWQPVEGATGYTLEVSIGDGEALTLASLDPSRTSYEDFGVPEGFPLTYRLTADGSGESYAVTVATPLDSNPYSVQPELQSAQPTIPGLDLGGLDLSNLDLSNFDPSTLDPSMFANIDPSSIDASNFDPSAFLQEAGVSDTIGSEGGQLIATGADGTTYTLTVPAGALDEPTYLLMTPITAIGGYPFSGGIDGAVQIEPEGLQLVVPAMLRIEPAAGAANDGTGLVEVAFGFNSDGSDFYLTPFYAAGESLTQAGSSTKLSDLLPGPHQAGPLAEIAASQLGPLGAGKAIPVEARSFAKQHTPQRPSSRSSQKAAAVQLPGDDDLTPLTLPETRLRLAAAGADNCRELLGVLGDYGTYVSSGLSKTVGAQINNQLVNDLAANMHAILNAEKFKCIHPQGCAQALADMLSSPANSAQKNLADAFNQKYPPRSDSTLKDTEEQRQACQLELLIESNLTLQTPEGGDGMLVRVRIPLKWGFDPFMGDNGYAYLKGSGPVTYVDINMNAKKCSFAFSSGGTGRTRFRVDRLDPLFDLDPKTNEFVVRDFELKDWSIPGNPNDMVVTCEETRNGKTVMVARQAQLGGGTCDSWCGHFTASREDSLSINTWDVTGSGQNPGVIATKTFNRQVPIPVPGATLTERTLFTIQRVK